MFAIPLRDVRRDFALCDLGRQCADRALIVGRFESDGARAVHRTLVGVEAAAAFTPEPTGRDVLPQAADTAGTCCRRIRRTALA